VAVDEAPASRPDQIVLTLQWREAVTGLTMQETYGPWTAADDLMHMIAVRDFIAGWQRLTGRRPDVATMAIAIDPGEWVRKQQKGAPPDDAEPWVEIAPAVNACGATVREVVCTACREVVPVECGDVTGMTLDDMIAEVRTETGRQHPDHRTIHIGQTNPGQ
jgi:hypothetical protein